MVICGRLREVPHAVWQGIGGWMGAETQSQGSTGELAGSFLTQGEMGEGGAFTHDRWVP